MAEGLDRLLDGRRLSPAQRRIAHYLAEHLHEAIFLSSVELAERAGVSQPSVTRFAIALGFAGFPDLRHALRPLVLNGNGAHAAGPGDMPNRTARVCCVTRWTARSATSRAFVNGSAEPPAACPGLYAISVRLSPRPSRFPCWGCGCRPGWR